MVREGSKGGIGWVEIEEEEEDMGMTLGYVTMLALILETQE